MSAPSPRVIGLLPAGGRARRISPLPLSKEVYPVGLQPIGPDGALRPKVVSHYLLEKMHQAGIDQAYFILRSGKWDIPSYFGDGQAVGLHLGYLIMDLPYGVAYTLDQAYPFVQGAMIALGFPDILFQPAAAYQQLLARQAATQAAVVLGLFPTASPHKVGMVDFDATGQVRTIVEKPPQTDLRYMWAIAVWTPTFTQFLHDYVQAIEARRLAGAARNLPTLERELPIGDVIQAALEAGLPVQAVPFANGRYLDIGTPEDLAQATQAAGAW